jgi:hypothetical protein
VHGRQRSPADGVVNSVVNLTAAVKRWSSETLMTYKTRKSEDIPRKWDSNQVAGSVTSAPAQPGLRFSSRESEVCDWQAPSHVEHAGTGGAFDDDGDAHVEAALLFLGERALCSAPGSANSDDFQRDVICYEAGESALAGQNLTECKHSAHEADVVSIQRGRLRPCFSAGAASSSAVEPSRNGFDGRSTGRLGTTETTPLPRASPIERLRICAGTSVLHEGVPCWESPRAAGVHRSTACPSSTCACPASGRPSPTTHILRRDAYANRSISGDQTTPLRAALSQEPARASSRRRTPLPKHAVAVFEAWARAHWDHPYPSDAVKVQLSAQTGVSVKQVSNWFINFRKRSWHGRR